TDSVQGLVLQGQSDAMFSPDGRFVYSLDRSGAVIVFRLTSERKLRPVQTFTDGANLLNASGIAFAPDGSQGYVAGAASSSLSVMRRDAKTGELTLHQVIRDEQGGVHGFARVYGVCTSADGRFVYTCSNRDHAVSALARGDDGKLTVMQEFINDQGDLKG